ncbi:MAG TPA: FAD-binding protein, partial [Actinomycetota bacterium]|nr:FAD-binding protein [Actinomycetota bacterium]
MASQRHEVDMLIIGAGPAGLYAAYYAGFRGLSTAIMDSLPQPGGQVSAMYPEKLIYDVAGFPAIKGQALVDNLVEQAAPFEPTYLLGHRADRLVSSADSVCVTSHAGTEVVCRAALITGGIGMFTPRKLPVGSEY